MIMTVEKKIEDALEGLRPYLKADGGDISLVEVTADMKALVEMHGACVTCSMSAMTMKAGVEEAIKKAVPEITEVKAVNL
ncbi:MAG: NifU family protein [Flavobacteriales bacterium]|nr:NifU family protein [Flavobacteriales bacterium]